MRLRASVELLTRSFFTISFVSYSLWVSFGST